MFIIAQLPLVDLRPMIPGELGRLQVPDWKADDPGEAFIRGFGSMSARNQSAYGLLGERAFADFNQAVRFNDKIFLKDEGWPRAVVLQPRFRRLYYDGQLSGRFEFGFVVPDEDEVTLFGASDSLAYDPSCVARRVRDIPLIIRSADGLARSALLHSCGEALGLAYIAATTSTAGTREYPPGETYGQFVLVGSPIVHIRVSANRPVVRSRDERQIVGVPSNQLFITSPASTSERNTVVVQVSPEGALEETGRERATRVLFSHLNSLIHAHSHFISLGASLDQSVARRRLRDVVDQMIVQFTNFKDAFEHPPATNDFAESVRLFAAAYQGRLDDLIVRLESLAKDLGKKTLAEGSVDYAKAVFELIVKTMVEATIPKVKM